MATRDRKRALYIDQESTFGTDPSGDGSGYTAVKVTDLSAPGDGTGVGETNFATGRNRATAADRLGDGGEITFSTPLLGMLTAAGDGTNASATSDDWFDLLLNCAFGAKATTAGEGVASATNTTFTTDADDNYGMQDLVPMQDAAANSARTQWRYVDGATSPYTVDRAWTDDPTATAVAYGAKYYRPSDTAGSSLSAVVDVDGTLYLCTGGRVNSLRLRATAKEAARLEWGVMFDSWEDDTSDKSALPTLGAFSGTDIQGVLGAVSWNGTEYATKSVEIDFGIGATEVLSVAGTNGRSQIEVTTYDPVVTIEPLHAAQWETDFRAGTTGALSVHLGKGVVSGGVLNSVCFQAMAAEVIARPEQSGDGNILRHTVQLKVVDGGTFSGSTIAHYWQLARA